MCFYLIVQPAQSYMFETIIKIDRTCFSLVEAVTIWNAVHGKYFAHV